MSSVNELKLAKVIIRQTLIKNDMISEIAVSIAKYIYDSLIASGLFLLTALESTNDECKYKLWGIIIAPTNPIAA